MEQVWGDVGLVLKAKHDGEDETEGKGGRVSFFLHHKDLASEMVKVVSDRVPVVELRGLNVVFDFCSGRRMEGTGKKKERRGVGKRKKGAPVEAEKTETRAQDGHRYDLRREPRPTTKVREVWRDAAVEEDDGREDVVPPKHAWSMYEMRILMDVGLRKLLGIGKAPQGFRTSKNGPAPSLMDIAPGVWNLRYLQARYLPKLASSC